MKKITSLILALVLAFSLVSLSACGGKATDDKNSDSADDKVITVGASATPHAEILEQVKQALADEGYELKIVTYDDYVLPNQALADGTLDANYFQHKPYLDSFNAKNGTSLVSVGAIHYEPFGIYGNGVTDLKGLAKGATIIIPADDSNETRALFLLAQEGLIDLPEEASAETGVTTLDIKDDHGFDVQAVQADTVPTQLANSAEGTVAVINGNYAIDAGLNLSDAIAVEADDSEAAEAYANVVAVKKGNENSDKIKALVAALQSEEVRKFMEETYGGAVVPLF